MLNTDANEVLEETSNNIQPYAAVVGEPEESLNISDAPHSESKSLEQYDLVVDDNADDAGEEHTKKQGGKAWKERELKRKQQEAIAKEKAEKEKKQKQLDREQEQQQLSYDVAVMKRGKKPDIDDYDSQESWESDYSKWQAAEPKKVEQSKVDEVNEDAIKAAVISEYTLSESHDKLKKELKGYDSVMDKSNQYFNDKFAENSSNAISQIAGLANLSGNKFDVAKIQAVLSNPKAQKEMEDASNRNVFGSEYQAIDFFVNLQNKYYKLNKPAGTSTTPPPIVKGSNSTHVNALEKKAAEKYYATGSMADYKELQKIRRQNKN